MRRTSFIMGMPVVIDVPRLRREALIELAFSNLRVVDEQFSPFKPKSELSRFRRGELGPENLSIGMKAIMKACLEAEKATGGYFSARYSDQFDPTGYVKGWALSEVKRMFQQRGLKTFCISAGGDITARSVGRKTWRIGIQNPKKPKTILAAIVARNISVATSGNYEKGHHIINPLTGKAPHELLSLTVAGADIIKADVLATTAFAMGKAGLKFIDNIRGYEVFAVDKGGTIFMSGGMASLIEGDLTITGKVV